MSMTATVRVPTLEPTSTPTPEPLRLLPSLGAWVELLRLSERWQEACRTLERQAADEALRCSPTP